MTEKEPQGKVDAFPLVKWFLITALTIGAFALLVWFALDAIVTTFAIGGLLAGMAGILYVLLFSKVIFTMGFFTGIKAFTAAVIGGIGSILGAAIGGLVLGVLEAVGPDLFLTGAGVPSPNQLQPVVAIATLVLVLIFRPRGILGPVGVQNLERWCVHE